ncbi:hypothetical protein DEW08_14480 [Azospirillum thermophilum]|uniref:Uncharacterized protein n=2 Tax=Azospirillum thermophilum TaxID=2202148 RepID=A0A2S2CUI3_9PROT|nr:hypothetical protein DEW08_14480 [Azospirillum thermophilum]
MKDPKETLHHLLDSYLRCPTEGARMDLEQALRSYQTDWIRARAGSDAPAAEPARGARPAAKPKFPIAAADLEVLRRMADGWTPTIGEVTRWAWFENRELVELQPNPEGSGPEVMRLAPAGWAAVGRTPPQG